MDWKYFFRSGGIEGDTDIKRLAELFATFSTTGMLLVQNCRQIRRDYSCVFFVKSACAVKAPGRNGQVQKLKGAQQYLVLNFVGLLSFVDFLFYFFSYFCVCAHCFKYFTCKTYWISNKYNWKETDKVHAVCNKVICPVTKYHWDYITLRTGMLYHLEKLIDNLIQK